MTAKAQASKNAYIGPPHEVTNDGSIMIVPGSAGEESIETKDGYKKSLAYRKAAELQKQWSVEVVRRISQ